MKSSTRQETKQRKSKQENACMKAKGNIIIILITIIDLTPQNPENVSKNFATAPQYYFQKLRP